MITQNTAEQNWYALYTKPRFEKKVCSLLFENNFNSYLPLVSTIKQWSDRKKKVELPLISSYVFVRTDESSLKKTLSLNGVIRILKHLGKPAIIKDYEIENLKILLEDPDNVNFINEIHIQKGDPIIVEKGVFRGLIAECVKLNGRFRLIARFEALNNVVEVNIPISHLKKINDI